MSAPTLLEQLQAYSVLAVETADLAYLSQAGARDVHLSAARVSAAAQMPEHADVVDSALRWAQQRLGKGGNRKLAAIRAVERVAVEFARRAVERVSGRVSVELDARLAFQTGPMAERGRETMRSLVDAGVDPQRALVRIPATWEGIQAAARLEREGIRCHLTLVFAMHQIAAAADAGVAVVSPAVGRISDFHGKQGGAAELPPAEDPGVVAVLSMLHYLRRHEYATELVPTTFRSADQALALAGCDGLCLPTALVDELRGRSGCLDRPRATDGANARALERLTLDAGSFATMHSADPLSSSKLAQGVKNLSWALVSQEKQLGDWIAARQDEAAKASAFALFRVWDYDGDGFIDREEWGGTDEVFNALDRNHDGRVSLAEMALGLGAPYKPGE